MRLSKARQRVSFLNVSDDTRLGVRGFRFLKSVNLLLTRSGIRGYHVAPEIMKNKKINRENHGEAKTNVDSINANDQDI